MLLSPPHRHAAKTSAAVAVPLAAALLVARHLRKRPRCAAAVPARPVLGNFWEFLCAFLEKSHLALFDKWHAQYGKTFAFNTLGALPGFGAYRVSTVDPKNIEWILKTNLSNYPKGTNVFYKPFFDVLGDGIFNVDGEKWMHQRKISSRLFTINSFKTHIWACITAGMAKVDQILHRDSEVDMFNLMNRFTLDTIGVIGFSTNIGSLEDPSSPFLTSFDMAQQTLVHRHIFAPHGGWRLFRFFGILWERNFSTHVSRLDTFARGIARELKEKVKTGSDNSFVGLFLADGSQGHSGNAYSGRDEESFLRDMILNFLIAGRDTTAQAVSWTIFELAQAPRVVTKMREEVKQVCGDGPISFDHAAKDLKYVQAVTNEGLRLHPSVPVNVKYAEADDVWPDGTFVPAGTLVHFNPFCQGRCAEIWGADCREFRPERWLEREARPTAFEFSAFNAGARECLGRRLAELEMVAFLANFVRRYRFELAVPASGIGQDMQLTIGMRPGLPLKVHPLDPDAQHAAAHVCASMAGAAGGTD